MKVYGALESAQIEWFTNAGKPAASSYPYRVIYVTDLKQIQVSDGTNWNPSAVYSYTVATLPAAGASNNNQIAFITDTLQVKVSNGTEWKTIGARLDTFTSGTIPAAASNTNSLIWVSDLQQVQVSNGTSWVQVGAKAGTKNYFSQNNANPDFETNSVTPWSACTLTFSGGVPSGAPTLTATQMAISTTSTTPLAGTYSMLLTKSAANAQYQGFISGALTIDREDTAKVLYGSFNYEVVSGTIDLSGSSTQSLEIWIYNTVSGAWTQPAGYRGMNQSSGVGKVVFSFQTDGTFANNTYKIAVFTQQTSTSAYVVEFDDFAVGPEAIVLGTPVTDWQDFPSVAAGTLITSTGTSPTYGTVSVNKARWRRVGDSAEIEWNFAQTSAGTNGTGVYLFNLPAPLVLDSSYTFNTNVSTNSTSISAPNVVGSFYANFESGAGKSVGFGEVIPYSNNKLKVYIGYITENSAVDADFWNTVQYPFALSPMSFTLTAKVKISGWSSNVQTSSDTDTRVVAFKAAGSITGGVTGGSFTQLIYGTSVTDTHGAYQSGNYIVPVSGTYNFTAQFVAGASSVSVGSSWDFQITKNSVEVAYTRKNAYSTSDNIFPINISTGEIECNAGDIIKVNSNPVSGWTSPSFNTASNGRTFFTGNRLSGPSVITATETVAARYTDTSGTSIPGGSTGTTAYNFATKDYDSHGAVTTGAGSWKFTAPVSGKYSVTCAIYFASSTWGTATKFISLRKNGNLVSYIATFTGAAYTGYLGLNGKDEIALNAGEYIDIQITHNETGSRNLDTPVGVNHISIVRVGN